MIEVRNEADFTEYLDTFLNSVETDDLEFKSAAGGFPGNFWDTYSAFANSEGGTIILGVAEKKGKFFLDTLSDEQIVKYTKDFWNNVNSRTTISCNLMKSDDLKVVEYKGHRNYSMEDLDKETINQYRQLFKIAKPSHPWTSLSDMDFLKKIGAYRKNRETKEEGFTVAGLLMFGKYESIIDNECCPDFFPDYQEKLSDNPQIRWTNRIYPDGAWETNLLQFYLRILPRLEAVLPKPFVLENNFRRDETLAHAAVREALVNFCIHTDFSENATMVVRLFPNKIVFSNPGTLLISRTQYYEGGESICRNKTLQKMFMEIGAAEKAGSSVDKILTGWHSANWRSPILKTKTRPDKVELTMMLESLLDEHTTEKLSKMFGTDIFGIGQERLLVLNAACTDGYVTNESLRVILNIHKGEIADLLKEMCNKRLLKSKGYGRGTRYYLASENNIPSSDANIPSSENSENGSIRQRMSFNELKKEICLACSDWVSLDELSLKVKRNKTYLKIYIIPRLLEDKSIEMMFPGVPKHPRQKYKIKK